MAQLQLNGSASGVSQRMDKERVSQTNYQGSKGNSEEAVEIPQLSRKKTNG